MSLKILAILVSIFAVAFLFCGAVLTVHAQSDLQTTKYRNMVIDLGNGLKTNARLNLPSNGDGPFPGVLLIHGIGPADMNETNGPVRIDNETGSIIYPPTRVLFEIAEYLSERGFAVLQYDKRGIGSNTTILDSNIWRNETFDDLKHDAEKALDVLLQQPEVDVNHVTLVGHSEGAMIAPRVAIDNPDKVKNIVLMGAVAQNLIKDITYSQVVTKPVLFAQQFLDHNHNGLISVQEASENPLFSAMAGNLTLVIAQNITTANGTAKQLNPQYNTNNDTFVSINDELKPRLIEDLKSAYRLGFPTPDGECAVCPILFTSHYALTPTLDIIGKVPSDTSILIQQGKNDSQTTMQQALLLQQELTEVKHPDHTLITYPDLGHFFYPSSQWLTSFGPMDQKVLEDLFGWLSDPVRDFKKLTILSSQTP